jgi:hypothetical protein
VGYRGPWGPKIEFGPLNQRIGGRVLIFKFSHTKKFYGNRLSPNELRPACEPQTGARRVYKWEGSEQAWGRAKERLQVEHSSRPMLCGR